MNAALQQPRQHLSNGGGAESNASWAGGFRSDSVSCCPSFLMMVRDVGLSSVDQGTYGEWECLAMLIYLFIRSNTKPSPLV
eukprot:24255_5